MKNFLRHLTTWVLTVEARLLLWKYEPKIIAVTGTVGKTSTKEAVAHLLSGTFRVGKSDKSYNSDIGVPLAIIGAHSGWTNPLKWLGVFAKGLGQILFPAPFPEWLVIEVGADRPGDISRLAEWLRPHIAIVTKLADVPVHVEFFPSPEAVAHEKLSLFRSVRPEGLCIYNVDDPRLREMSPKYIGADSFVVRYGSDSRADWRLEKSTVHNTKRGRRHVPDGVSFTLTHQNLSTDYRVLSTLALHEAYIVTPAIIVASWLQIPASVVETRVATIPPTRGRMRIITGIQETTIIDDTYNASPVALAAALASLQAVTLERRKIVVLGDMLELGKYTIEAHALAGAEIAKVADLFIAVGPRMKFAYDSALESGMLPAAVFHAQDAFVAGTLLSELLSPGDLVLVKGSQSMRMERVVKEVMANPEDGEAVLVRQEKEWQSR